MLAGASAAAHAAGFAVDVLSLEGGTDARTDRIIDLADSGQVDGIVSFAPASATLESQVSSGTTVVVSGDFDDEMRGIGELLTRRLSQSSSRVSRSEVIAGSCT